MFPLTRNNIICQTELLFIIIIYGWLLHVTVYFGGFLPALLLPIFWVWPQTMTIRQEPTGSDAGKYKCVAMNQFGEAAANVNLNIESEPEEKGQAPVFVEKPQIKWEEGASRVLMEALVKADPKPTSKWTKNGVVVESSSKCSATVVLEKEHTYRIRLELRVKKMNGLLQWPIC